MGRFTRLHQIHSPLLVLFFHSMFHCSPGLSFSINQTLLCSPEHHLALIQFNSTLSIGDPPSDFLCHGTSYPKTRSWNENTDCCTLEGVTCDQATGQVIGLDLSCSKLAGSLSLNSTLFRLQGLQRLNLAFNSFNGELIPSGLSQLVSLTHLNLSGNHFCGSVPSDISLLSKLISLDISRRLKIDSHSFGMLTRNLSKLENLFLSGVNMSDVAPTSFKNLSSSLKRLSLPVCHLHGEVPSELFQLEYLEYLKLHGNYLTGYLPMFNRSSPLMFLDLWGNDFRGSIPESLGNLTKLTYLEFGDNNIQSKIPDVFGNLNKLTYLSLCLCNFSGQLPSSLFNLTQLTYLDLALNSLQGPLPIHVSGLQKLQHLYLGDNLFSGTIPSWLFTQQSVDLHNNSFTAITNQSQNSNLVVQRVTLAHNNIHGEIPSFFFDLVNLVNLDLSSNNFSGVIESDGFLRLENLTTLDLSKNNFSGVVKFDVFSKMKSLMGLDLSNNKLLSWGSESVAVNSTFPKLNTLSLSSCNGRTFPDFLRLAESLTDLDLSYNKIQGSIFRWETQGWKQLSVLNLSHNLLTGFEQFPGKNLQVLDLRSNLLQGHLPALPSSLEEIFIQDNNLAGEIPASICSMTSLQILDLSRNHLGGTIPACLANFSIHISTINLQMNTLRGKIPDFCVGQNILTALSLNDNQLEGLLPRSLMNCTFLRILSVANNKLSDTFPHWLSVLSDLQVLILRFNRFHGPLNISKDVKSSFSSLQIIDLSHNEFTGPLPSTFFRNLVALKDVRSIMPPSFMPRRLLLGSFNEDGQISVNITCKRSDMGLELARTLLIFTAIDFSSNRFHGKIPEEIGELYAIQMLNLSHNSFSGHIPQSLGNLVQLESLDLSSNKLSGRIPSQLANLTFLEVLNFSHNNLVGPIPYGKQFSTFENDSYQGNLGLCGFPLTKQCGSSEGPKSPAKRIRKDDEGSRISFFLETCNDGIWKRSCGRNKHSIHSVHHWEAMVACEKG
ncbi:receptor-like protein 6 [Hibiscus syriacus]|uniref:receptor-like protein 6 n=1 Tax=Hibiscus syriacus TaxID=106335 RepID=UPI001922DF11|nr:receptor-like protein 6 [Hibiscus syriacus]